MNGEEHDLQLGHGIKLFYTLSRNEYFALITLDLHPAEFKLSEADQEALAKLPNLRRHRRCVSSEKVIIRIFRKNLVDVLQIFLKILNAHITEGTCIVKP